MPWGGVLPVVAGASSGTLCGAVTGSGWGPRCAPYPAARLGAPLRERRAGWTGAVRGSAGGGGDAAGRAMASSAVSAAGVGGASDSGPPAVGLSTGRCGPRSSVLRLSSRRPGDLHCVHSLGPLDRPGLYARSEKLMTGINVV